MSLLGILESWYPFHSFLDIYDAIMGLVQIIWKKTCGGDCSFGSDNMTGPNTPVTPITQVKEYQGYSGRPM